MIVLDFWPFHNLPYKISLAIIPRMPRIDAIDVARYQHVTDEPAIPALPLMTCKGSEGATYKDSTRHMWLRIFGERKAIRGMYHWVRSDSPLLAQVENLASCYEQAGAFVGPGRTGGLRPGWIVQLDWERTYRLDRSLVRDLTPQEIEQWCAYADEVFGANRLYVYVSDWVPGFHTWRARNPHRPLWYANYNLGDSPTGGRAECARYNADIWQWSSQVQVPGLDTTSRPGIDVNEIINWDLLYRTARVTPPPTPTPAPPAPTQETDDMAIATNEEVHTLPDGRVYGPGIIKWVIGVEGRRHISEEEWTDVWGRVAGAPLSNATLAVIPVIGATSVAPAPVTPVIDYYELATQLAQMLPTRYDGSITITAAG